MRLRYITIEDGKRRILWTALLAFVLTAYAIVIGSAELFWYLFTGGLSPLVGGFALVTATLIVIRAVGASLTMPITQLETRLDTP